MNSEFQGNGENNFVNSKLRRNGEIKDFKCPKWASIQFQ